jgi:hypothetical protein
LTDETPGVFSPSKKVPCERAAFANIHFYDTEARAIPAATKIIDRGFNRAYAQNKSNGCQLENVQNTRPDFRIFPQFLAACLRA